MREAEEHSPLHAGFSQIMAGSSVRGRATAMCNWFEKVGKINCNDTKRLQGKWTRLGKQSSGVDMFRCAFTADPGTHPIGQWLEQPHESC